MRRFTKSMLVLGSVLGLATAAHANLLVNGGFEASDSLTETPPGWVNIGHEDGVIPYATFGTPAYEGLNFYDLGGYGDPYGPIGDGIAQSFATVVGATYTVQFGLSSENNSGTETLTVSAGDVAIAYLLTVTGEGDFQRPFETQTFDFVATDATTTLSFITTGGITGNNDPLIDGVSVVAVPEPQTYALLLAGLGALGWVAKRRRAT